MLSMQKLTLVVFSLAVAGCQSFYSEPIDDLPPTAALPDQQNSGAVFFRYYDNIPGGDISSLTSSSKFPDEPDDIISRHSISSPFDRGDNYGTYVRGYIQPPESGTYRFFLTGDNETAFYLGDSSDPESVKRIARVPHWAREGDFSRYYSQVSSDISLVSGELYYFELLHKEQDAGDHFSVAWEGPGVERAVIEGRYLYSFGQGNVEYPDDEQFIAGYELGYRIGHFEGNKELPFDAKYPPVDSDRDGLTDNYEIFYGLDPMNAVDASTDRDDDLLAAYEEFWIGTNPTNSDTDGDGVPDGEEYAFEDDPLEASEENGSGDEMPVSDAVELSWTAPSFRVDGSTLSLGEISQYVVRYGQDPDDLSQEVEVPGEETGHSFTDLEPGLWYFSVRAVDNEGVRSAPSEPVQFQVD